MFLPEFSIRRPVGATIIVASLLLFGFIGVTRLGISLYPNVDFPIVTISTVWENARPEEVDNEITDELEDAISSVSEIKHIISQSMQGLSRITVEFELTKDIDVAAQEIRDKVSSHLRNLPDNTDVPVIDKLDINANPIIWLAVTGQQSIEEVTRVTDDQIRPMLQKLSGVGEVRIAGERKKEVQIRLYRERLAAYGIGVSEVIAALHNQHIEIPGGKIESRNKEFLIRTMGEFRTPEAFNNLIITYRKGTPILLKQVGYAESGREESSLIAKFATKNSIEKTVALGVAPRSGANEVAIAKGVKMVLPEIQRILPAGMHIEISSDTTEFIEESIAEVKFQLLLGAIMAAMVIFLFLQNIRTTLISAVAIPASIISTFACIYAMGFTLNNMTMLALITSVGLVIDDAIVVVENIFRHRSALGKGPIEAAKDGSSEVAFAVVAATLTLAGVFIPIAFLGGIVGRFFSEFGITMAFAVACSLLVALTMVPMLSSRFLTYNKTDQEGQGFKIFNRMMDWVTNVYRIMLTRFLEKRLYVLLLGLIMCFLGGWIFTFLGKEFVTAEDQSRFLIRVQAPLTYSMEKMDTIMRRLEIKLQTIPEVKHFFSIAGAGGGGSRDASKGLAFVTLVPKNDRKRSQFEVQDDVQKIIQGFPDLVGGPSQISMLGGGSRSEDIQFIIQGPEISEINKYSQAIIKRLSALDGYVGTTTDMEIGKPEVRVRIDREKAADMGVSVRDIASAVGALLGGIDLSPSTYKEGGKSYDIRLRLISEERLLPGDVQRIWIRSKTGTIMEMSNFVELEIGLGPNVINRMDRQRSATIFTNLNEKMMGDAISEVANLAKEILPDGYTYKFSGKAEAFADTKRNILFAFILAIIITYMVLAAQFESFIQPFSIMMGLPLTFVGAFGLLYLFGNTFNLFSMIGLVLLVGLVTKNGILLIDYTNQLRAKGMDINEALVEAGATRLRPILMTAISTIAGVLPVALGIGVGSESRQPLAVAITGGMISSTFLTLAVVPVIYSYLEEIAHLRWFENFKTKIIAKE